MSGLTTFKWISNSLDQFIWISISTGLTVGATPAFVGIMMKNYVRGV